VVRQNWIRLKLLKNEFRIEDIKTNKPQPQSKRRDSSLRKPFDWWFQEIVVVQGDNDLKRGWRVCGQIAEIFHAKLGTIHSINLF
jgi:hypothetical protein